VALAIGAGLLVAATVVGRSLQASGVPLHVQAPPFFAWVDPRLGPRSLAAVLVAGLVVAYGPRVTGSARWPVAVVAAAAAAALWTTALALSRGWRIGVAHPLTAPSEYLSEVPGAPAVGELLATFADRIPSDAPDRWTTHVAGHPPGALLVYVGLDRIGLGGGSWAGALSLVSAGVVVAATGVAIRALCGEQAGRAVLPFAALFPGAVWMGVSADAVFAAVGAVGLALLAVAVSAQPGPRRLAWAASAGLLLGAGLFLSYGLVLLAVPGLTVVVLRRAWDVLVVAALVAIVLVAAIGVAGFRWWEGLDILHTRYLEGFGGERPWSYFVWAGPAGLVAVVGPAAVAGSGRLVAPRDSDPAAAGARALALGALGAVLLAAASGLSKGETERIWLPVAVWVLVATVALPRRGVRWWLGAQALTGLLLEHLLWTPW
jgi:methylthioxylose transferase